MTTSLICIKRTLISKISVFCGTSAVPYIRSATADVCAILCPPWVACSPTRPPFEHFATLPTLDSEHRSEGVLFRAFTSIPPRVCSLLICCLRSGALHRFRLPQRKFTHRRCQKRVYKAQAPFSDFLPMQLFSLPAGRSNAGEQTTCIADTAERKPL